MALVLLSSVAQAQNEKTSRAYIEEIVTYSSRSSITEQEISYTVHVLDETLLSRQASKTMPDSLASLPGVHIQKTASGHGSPYIRGFTGNRTLTVVDGVRYNNATYRDGPNEYFSQLDNFTLKQVELLSGPSSSLYGSEAVGGTISVMTKDSGFMEHQKAQKFLNVEQVFRLSSGDQSRISHTAINTGHGQQWGLRLGFSSKQYGNIQAANIGELPYTEYSEKALDVRYDVELSKNWSATIVHQKVSQDDVPRTHSTIFSKSFKKTSIGSDLKREKDHSHSLNYLKLKGFPSLIWADSVEITMSHQPRKESEYRIKSSGIETKQAINSTLAGFSTVIETSLLDFSLTYGIDYFHEAVDSKRTDFDPATQSTISFIQGPVGDDARYEQAGIFVKSIWHAFDKVTIELGGRSSYIHSSIGRYADPLTGNVIQFEGSWSDLSGTIRLNYTNNKTTIWGAVSQSFRAPNIADISRFGLSRSNEFEVASFNLNPERFSTWEIGYRKKINYLDFSGTYFITTLKDYIDTVVTGRTVNGLIEVHKQNALSGKIQGFEISSAYSLNSTFTISANLAWLEGDQSVTNCLSPVTEPISRIQPLTTYFSLNWEKGKYWASTEILFTDLANKLNAGDLGDTQRIPPSGTPAYSIYNIRGGWSINDNIELNAGLLNLFDKAYRSHGSGNNEPGRHILLGILASF